MRTDSFIGYCIGHQFPVFPAFPVFYFWQKPEKPDSGFPVFWFFSGFLAVFSGFLAFFRFFDHKRDTIIISATYVSYSRFWNELDIGNITNC